MCYEIEKITLSRIYETAIIFLITFDGTDCYVLILQLIVYTTVYIFCFILF